MPWGARSAPLGGRYVDGACGTSCMRGMKGSQMRWMAEQMSKWADGSGWLGRQAGDGWWEGGQMGR